MSDLLKEANFLRFYYTSDDAVKDKDILKNKAYLKYQQTATGLFMLPLGL